MTVTMTETDARTFDTFSPVNAAIAESGCSNGCQAYVDVFTFPRWIAQGRAVRKGEHGTRITTYSPVYRIDKATGERVAGKRIPRTSVVFCRCQTDALGERSLSDRRDDGTREQPIVPSGFTFETIGGLVKGVTA